MRLLSNMSWPTIRRLLVIGGCVWALVIATVGVFHVGEMARGLRSISWELNGIDRAIDELTSSSSIKVSVDGVIGTY